MPELGGLELQKRIAREGTDMPIIFITGYGDVPTTVQAMKAGAVEFLTKPFTDDALAGRDSPGDRPEPSTRWTVKREMQASAQRIRIALPTGAGGYGAGGQRQAQ